MPELLPGYDIHAVPSPAYVLDESLLIRNLELLRRVKEEAGVQIILALKGFAMWRVFPLVHRYLDGATASSLHEAMLIAGEMGCKAHTYCPVIVPQELDALLACSSHLTFNSLSEYQRYKEIVFARRDISWGIRVNPGYSDVGTDLYNPVTPGSRLGVPVEQFEDGWPEGLDGIHFHALCENDSYSLERVLDAFESRFGRFLHRLRWVNMGGGHLITREGYDHAHLIRLLRAFRERYDVEVILEPGSAIAWQTGDLVATVLDVVPNGGILTAMLDVSFTAHMPDTLEMPYRPAILGARDPQPGDRWVYRLGGTSCLSGDFMSEYSFDNELRPGDRIVLRDMIHYTMVKTTTFNGVRHPSIVIARPGQAPEIVKTFGYEDFKGRLS